MTEVLEMVMLMVVICDDTQALSPLTDFFFFIVLSPSFAVSVNTLHHRSTRLPVSVLFLPVSVWLTAVLLLFPHTVGESKLLVCIVRNGGVL